MLIRSFILYFLVIFAVRIMGKRQIGELQPSELVITILISEAASIPLQDTSIPMSASFIPVMTLVSLEIIMSLINMKSIKLRNLFSGQSIKVIKDGKIDQKMLKKLRFTTDDLLEALRQKDVFDLREVDTAIVETNGVLSVLKSGDYSEPTLKELGIKPEPRSIPEIFISDGKIIKDHIGTYGITEQQINKQLRKKSIEIKDVFLMTGDTEKNYTIIIKDSEK